MKPYNEKEFNKLCAEFLGYVNTTPTDPDFSIYENRNGFIIDGKQYTLIEPMSMKFHSDWNWIHMIKEEICKMKLIDEFNTTYDSVAKGWDCYIFPAYINTFNSFISNTLNTEKEAVIETIWQFLQWYNEQK